MGFYFRKALGFGPLRVNLSKSGVGFSVGVTGARIGINPRGQAYVHAGRAGFYLRQNLGRPTPSPAIQLPAPPPPVAPDVTLFESSDAAQLSGTSLADLMAALQRVNQRTSRVSLVALGAIAIFAMGACAGALSLTSDTGLNEMFHTSRASVPRAVEAAVHAMPDITFTIKRAT